MAFDVVVTVLGAYFIGSIPAAYLVARAVAGVDVRDEGEGNVGARNVFHVVGPRWGVVAFAADFGKGAAVAALVRDEATWVVAAAGTAVLIGHAYPVWLGFIGGKGLSTVGGVAAVLMPVAALIGVAGGVVTWLLFRRFLPVTVVAIVLAIAAAPVIAVDTATLAVVVGLFALTGVKRALDEERMRVVEASSGWDRVRGLRS